MLNLTRKETLSNVFHVKCFESIFFAFALERGFDLSACTPKAANFLALQHYHVSDHVAVSGGRE